MEILYDIDPSYIPLYKQFEGAKSDEEVVELAGILANISDDFYTIAENLSKIMRILEMFSVRLRKKGRERKKEINEKKIRIIRNYIRLIMLAKRLEFFETDTFDFRIDDKGLIIKNKWVVEDED